MTDGARESLLGLRERRKQQTRQRIQDEALRLFLADGFAATSVDQIAGAAGVSQMTFFRYFPTKESVIENDDFDPIIAAAIERRPAGEDRLTAIERALRSSLVMLPADQVEIVRVRANLIWTTPALRARAWENQITTQELFASALARREGLSDTGFGLQVVAAAALAALTTALIRWSTDASEQRTLSAIVGVAFEELRRSVISG